MKEFELKKAVFWRRLVSTLFPMAVFFFVLSIVLFACQSPIVASVFTFLCVIFAIVYFLFIGRVREYERKCRLYDYSLTLKEDSWFSYLLHCYLWEEEVEEWMELGFDEFFGDISMGKGFLCLVFPDKKGKHLYVKFVEEGIQSFVGSEDVTSKDVATFDYDPIPYPKEDGREKGEQLRSWIRKMLQDKK